MKKKIIIFLSTFLIGINITYAKEIVEFSKCVDGDTIKIILNEKEYTVRMLAIDTPESVHPTKGVEYYGKEASEYTCNKVTNAKKIELEYDENSDQTDKYDRLLAWVFVDGSLLQKDLVTNGYAKVAYLYDDYKYTKKLKTAQELASAKNIGIWDEDAKTKYNNENGIIEATDTTENDIDEIDDNNTISSSGTKSNDYSSQEIIIIGILLLTIVFIGDKTIKKKAKKKLKQYIG